MRIRYFIGVYLLLALADCAAPALGETEYFAVFMEGKKVGYTIQSRAAADGKVTTTEEVSITISRANVPITMNMSETNSETTDGNPLGFASVQALGIMAMKVV